MKLVRYDEACRALAAARSVDEVKHIRDVGAAQKAYAKQAKNRAMLADAKEIIARAERRLGEMMEIQKRTVGLNRGAKGSKPKVNGVKRTPVKDERPTLEQAGIDKNLAKRARKAAAIPEKQFEEAIQSVRKAAEAEDIKPKHNHRAQGTGENEWYTPSQFVEAARSVLGAIDLDPASSKAAQATIKAAEYFDVRDNGLKQRWDGAVWLNPPYAQPLIQQFIEKLIDEIANKHTDHAILLTHNYTDTTWFHLAASACNAICFTRGRIKFMDQNGNEASPTQGQAFFYFGDDVNRFKKEFKPFGFVVRA